MKRELIIFSHRGLDPDNKEFPWSENTTEAHANLLSRGYGIEFDLYPDPEGKLLISHGPPSPAGELKGTTGTLQDILSLIASARAPLHALHLKGTYQTEPVIEQVIRILKPAPAMQRRILIFDLLPQSAARLKAELPQVLCAPSAAHPFDIKRYNTAVSGTLLSVKEALKEPVFDWVWLDEWDTRSQTGRPKKLYSAEIFAKCRNAGKKIAIVSPELHATSPGLLGGESHPDAINRTNLEARLVQILSLKPDAVCTDHHDLLRKLSVAAGFS